MALLDPEHRSFIKETDQLLALLGTTAGVAPEHRKVISEVVLLRLSILLENHLKIVFAKLSCGAAYLDGSQATLLASFRSMNAAITAMKTLGRAKPRHPVWNDGAEIRENVAYMIDSSDHCITVMKSYASDLTEIRSIRNHIAHRNDGSRRNFKNVVRRHYGAYVPSVTCGTLLVSERVSKPPLLEVYIRTSRVLIKDLIKA